MIRWLHHTARAFLRLNAYLTALKAAEQDRDEALAERDRAVAQAAAARVAALLVSVEALALVRQAQAHAEGCRAVVGMLIEPGWGEQCHKVRLRDEEEAWYFAARVQAETGAETTVHKCKFCPRQPVSLQPFWHVTHADKAKRGQYGRADQKQPARLLDHVSPADVARMRDRARGEAS